MEEADFEAYFGGGNKTWAVTLSDGTVKPLKRDGADLPVTFDERHDYMQTVIETRMAETNDQVGLHKLSSGMPFFLLFPDFRIFHQFRVKMKFDFLSLKLFLYLRVFLYHF